MQTLAEAINQQIELGHKNPHEIYDVLERQLGDELVELARPYLADFIAEMARHRMNSLRLHDVAKITSKSLASPEIKLRSLWVPSRGQIIYKRIADMTAEDFDARAAYLENMTRAIGRHADWCRRCAQEIRDAGVKTAGKLKSLPALEDSE